MPLEFDESPIYKRRWIISFDVWRHEQNPLKVSEHRFEIIAAAACFLIRGGIVSD